MNDSPPLKIKSPSPFQRPASNTSNVPPIADGSEAEALLDDIVRTICTYVVMDEEQATAAALWIAMTHFIDVIEVAPLALITAPEKACGKSQLLTIFGYLVANSMSAANSSTSFIFRIIEQSRPTLLIDEADTFLKENGELKGIINAGHTRNQAFVGRTESKRNGDYEPKLFNVWCAKAFAGIALEKHLPPATISRSIVITLRRKLPHESVSRLRHAARTSFVDLASRLKQFGKNFAERIKNARPELPDALNDRAQDNWEPLFAIAQCASPEWLARATAAALKLSKSDNGGSGASNELLEDIQEVFEAKGTSKISSADLIEALTSDPDRAWASYNRGRPLTPRQLATMLGGYGIKPKTVRLGAYSTPKGYDLAQFADAFSRYLTQRDHDVPPPLPDMDSGVADGQQQVCHIPGMPPPRNPHQDACSITIVPEPVPSSKPAAPSPATAKLWEAVASGGVADTPRRPVTRRPESEF